MLSVFFQKFNVFFLDLDGLLLDTEPLHYQAFMSAGRNFNYDFSLSFSFYLELVSKGRAFLKNFLFTSHSNLTNDWDSLYRCKGDLYTSLLINNSVNFMLGAKSFLQELIRWRKKIVVVTNSERAMVDVLRNDHPLLQKIKYWVVREDYNLRKPDPDSYLKAKELYLDEEDKVIGFEDSIKGLTALVGASVPGVLVNSYNTIREQGKDTQALVLKSLEDTLHNVMS